MTLIKFGYLLIILSSVNYLFNCELTFVVLRSSFLAYDSIEHSLVFQGTGFDEYIGINLVIQFNRSNLIDEQLKYSCSALINCTTIDATKLNCTKEAFRDECLPKQPEEKGSWAADVTIYSGDQSYIGLLPKRIIIHPLPIFNSVIWEPRLNKFLVNSQGSVFLDPKAHCEIINGPEDQKEMIANLTRYQEIWTFEFDPNPLYKVPLNCSIQLDHYYFPLGEVIIDSILTTFPFSQYALQIVLVIASAFIIVVACLTGIVLINAQRNSQLRTRSALNIFPSIQVIQKKKKKKRNSKLEKKSSN